MIEPKTLLPARRIGKINKARKMIEDAADLIEEVAKAELEDNHKGNDSFWRRKEYIRFEKAKEMRTAALSLRLLY